MRANPSTPAPVPVYRRTSGFSSVAVPDSNGKYPVVLPRLVCGFDFPGGDADDHNPVSLRHELRRLRERSFDRLRSRLKQVFESTASAVGASQRPVFACLRQTRPARPIAAKKSPSRLIFSPIFIEISPSIFDHRRDPAKARALTDQLASGATTGHRAPSQPERSRVLLGSCRCTNRIGDNGQANSFAYQA